MEELGSLLEPIGTNEGVFINNLFNPTQWECGTSDRLIRQEKMSGVFAVGPWEIFVDFYSGRIHHRRFREGNARKAFVRVVRTMVPE